MKEKVAFFGFGGYGRKAFSEFSDTKEIVAYIDNDQSKWGQQYKGVPVMGLDEFINSHFECNILITCSQKYANQIKEQLLQYGITDCKVYRAEKEVIVSYSHPYDREDLILFHVLKNDKEIFYIDVGSSNPIVYSVTKLLYDQRGAHGINIEPQAELAELTREQRTRDITICAGVGQKTERKRLYLQGGLSTVVDENVRCETSDYQEIPIFKLADLCEMLIPAGRHISFLKIDVEGFEREVLLGTDFSRWRPQIVVMESTKPNSDVFIHEKWEEILTQNNYHYVKTYGVNRYYVANECAELDTRFIPMQDILSLYDVYETVKIKQ